jgi:hypothetical protein
MHLKRKMDGLAAGAKILGFPMGPESVGTASRWLNNQANQISIVVHKLCVVKDGEVILSTLNISFCCLFKGVCYMYLLNVSHNNIAIQFSLSRVCVKHREKNLFSKVCAVIFFSCSSTILGGGNCGVLIEFVSLRYK